MSVYKYKLQKNLTRWAYQYIDVNGRHIQKRGFHTMREAKRGEALMRQAPTVSTTTVSEVAEDYIRYLDTHRAGTSGYSVESVYRLHINPIVGQKRITEIKMADMQELQNVMSSKVFRGNKKYSAKTINMVTGILNMILNYATRLEYIEKNPCSNFVSLKIVRTDESLLFWSDTEFKKAISYENDLMWYTFFVVLYLTGMRKGEIRGLRWTDIDFTNKKIYIRRHVRDKKRVNATKVDEEDKVIYGRKNGDGIVLAMDNNLSTVLKRLKRESMTFDGWHKGSYVFGMKAPVSQNQPQRRLDKLAKSSGVKRIKVHGLRHSHVSYLTDKGLSVYEVAERIGDSVEIVLKKYKHMFPDAQKNVVNLLNDNFDF